VRIECSSDPSGIRNGEGARAPMLIVLMLGSRDDHPSSAATFLRSVIQAPHLEFAAFAVAIHQQHGHAALADRGSDISHVNRQVS